MIIKFNDLQQYNIIPNKTYLVEHLPTNIPKHLMSHYLRGLFDGDGCLTYSKDMTCDVSFGFVSYYESLTEDFRNLIDDLIHKEKHNKLTKTSAWNVHWRGYKQVVDILDILYNDANFYLERKYNKYLQLKSRK